MKKCFKNRIVSDINQAEAESADQSGIIISHNVKSNNNSGVQADLDTDSVGNTPLQYYLHDILMELREQSIKQQTIKKCLLFFTVLTVISLIFILIAYIQIIKIINLFSYF